MSEHNASKHIVLCSDGTGQAGGQGFVSNVWRVFKAVDRHRNETPQVAFHVDGVGTDSNRYLKALGGGFGWGLSDDIKMLYASLVRSFEPNCKIFLFGFSRGAFTVRSLAGMIDSLGILKLENYKSDDALDKAVDAAYKLYRKENPDLSTLGAVHDSRSIEFVGVWDTVDAIGVPVDEMREAIYAIAKFWRTPHKDELNPSIKNAFHAISIDDERLTFHPMIWNENKFKGEGKVEQVCFAGVHSNVGGGYPKDSLSYISLDWMMKKARELGLRFLESKWINREAKPLQRGEYQEQADDNGRIYDSRGGVGIYYRYKPRNLVAMWEEAQSGNADKRLSVHRSALRRIETHNTGYAPTAVSGKLQLVDTWDDTVTPVDNGPNLDEPWRCIRIRRGLYFAFVLWTVLFLLAGVFLDYGAGDPCNGNGFCASTLSAVKSVTPGFMGGWLDSHWANGKVLVGFIVTLLVMHTLRSRWKTRTESTADHAWRAFVTGESKVNQPPNPTDG